MGLARIELRDALIFADGLQGIPLFFRGIGGRSTRAKRGGFFSETFGGAHNRVGTMAAALGWVRDARYDELRLVEILRRRSGILRGTLFLTDEGGCRNGARQARCKYPHECDYNRARRP